MDIINCRLWDGVQHQRLAGDGVWTRLLDEWIVVRSPFKVNASYGCVIEHKTTGELRYYHSSSNNATLFDRNSVVRSREDLDAFYSSLGAIDIEEIARARRPDTTWQLRSVTNITFYVYKMLGSARIGCSVAAPPHLIKNKHVRVVTIRSRLQHQNLCFFRCLALAIGCCCAKRCECKDASAARVVDLYRRYAQHIGSITTAKDFLGVRLEDLLDMERLFGVCINVVRINPDRTSERVWTSQKAVRDRRVVFLDLHENHFSLVTDINAAVGAHTCRTCSQVFTRFSNLKRHSCDDSVTSRRSFVGGGYGPPKDVFQRIGELVGRRVEKIFFPYRATFDIECFMDTSELPSATARVSHVAQHRLLSISVASNVPGLEEPVCYLCRGTEDECVRNLVSRLLAISREASRLMRRRLSGLIQELERLESAREQVEETFGASPRDHTDLLFRFTDVLPVVGFNSQKYDINVIKASLVRALVDAHDCDEDDESVSPFRFVIKRDNKMACIETSRLRFLDICNFIAPGFSYAKYLRAYGVEENKGFFPYEWVTSKHALDYPHLPPIEAFKSEFKGTELSETNYAICCRAWTAHSMTSFADFVVWYNNLDVKPMLEAIKNQSAVYARKGIDMLKDAVSLPGLAVLWKFAHVTAMENGIRLLSREDSELYSLVKKNIVGGPSIVFHRYHERGVTRIRPAELTESPACQTILGVDANALYLYCMMQKMPNGRPLEWTKTADRLFSCKPHRSSRSAASWLAWCNTQQEHVVVHEGNGREVRVGGRNLAVDGFCVETCTVYQFHGCYWHAHPCTGLRGDHPTKKIPCEEVLARTLKNDEYIRSLGYSLTVIWECQWRHQRQIDPAARQFATRFDRTNFPKTSPKHEDQLLDEVDRGTFFGFLECDIRVPSCLAHKFSEMAPIFTHAKVGRDHARGRMRDWLIKNKRLSVPQPTLVGVTEVKKILLLSDLVAWYRRQGLVVDVVHHAYQFVPWTNFKAFGESVCDARRLGDADPSMSLLADTSKLIGNSAYGKLITNKDGHKNVKYAMSSEEASATIASANFFSMSELDGDGEIYETTSYKRKVRFYRLFY